MGIIEQVGEGVTLLKKGDRVVMPFNVADGRCRNCEEGKTAFCTGVNPGFAGGAYGMCDTTLFPHSDFPSPHDWLIMNQAMLPWAHTVEVSTPSKGLLLLNDRDSDTGEQVKHSSFESHMRTSMH